MDDTPSPKSLSNSDVAQLNSLIDKAYRDTHHEERAARHQKYMERPGVKEHAAKKHKEWYDANREYALERQRIRRESQRTELAAKQREYMANLDPEVKAQRNADTRARRAERDKARSKKYYQANRERILKRVKEYAAEKKEDKAEYSRKYREKHHEELLKKKREYRDQNLEQVREAARESQLRRHDAYLEYQRQYHRARRNKALTVESEDMSDTLVWLSRRFRLRIFGKTTD